MKNGDFTWTFQKKNPPKKIHQKIHQPQITLKIYLFSSARNKSFTLKMFLFHCLVSVLGKTPALRNSIPPPLRRSDGVHPILAQFRFDFEQILIRFWLDLQPHFNKLTFQNRSSNAFSCCNYFPAFPASKASGKSIW